MLFPSTTRSLITAFALSAGGLALSLPLCLAQEAVAPPAKADTPKPAAKAKAQSGAKAAAKPAANPIVPYTIAPTAANVSYGDHPRQVLDFWQAKSDQPTPLVFFIHGGGWNSGDKSSAVRTLDLPKLLANGVSVATINYRMVPQAYEAGIEPPVKWPLSDAARALQFVRSKAGEWNLDKARVGACGGSAGACSSLWLAMHDDMAVPNSSDPIERESTRLWCAVVSGAQTSLDPVETSAWIPNMEYGGHAFGFREAGQGRPAEFQKFLAGREKVIPWLGEYSPASHASKDDPTLVLFYGQKEKAEKGDTQKDPTHSILLGKLLKEKLDSLGVKCIVTSPAEPDPSFTSITESLMTELKAAK
jgi:hypothetical protein